MSDTKRLSIRIPAYMRRGLQDIRDEENASIIAESAGRGIDDRYGSAGNLIQGGITISGLVHRALWSHVYWCRENGRMNDAAWDRYKAGFDKFYRGGDELNYDPKYAGKDDYPDVESQDDAKIVLAVEDGLVDAAEVRADPDRFGAAPDSA